MTMTNAAFRPLLASEEEILRKLLSLKFAGCDELAKQLDGLLAKPTDAQGSLEFRVTSPVTAAVSRGVVAEARYADTEDVKEGAPHVNVLLHAAEGKLRMLEVYKDDSSPILKRPSPESFKLFSPLASS